MRSGVEWVRKTRTDPRNGGPDGPVAAPHPVFRNPAAIPLIEM